MMMMHTLACTAVAVGLVLSGPAAMADHGRGRDKDKDKDKDKHRGQQTVVVFADPDRNAVRSYWLQTYGRGKCPPGLAKKGNGCLPPGIAAKRYVIGQPLPASLAYYPAPRLLVSRLSPAPAGYQYVMVDGDLVKMAVDTRLVADAITLMLN